MTRSAALPPARFFAVFNATGNGLQAQSPKLKKNFMDQFAKPSFATLLPLDWSFGFWPLSLALNFEL